MGAAWAAAAAVIGGALLGKKKKAAAPPSAYQTAMGEAAAYRDSAPMFLSTDQQYLPAFADLDNKIALSTADTLAAGELELQRKYAPGFVDLQLELGRRADPNGFATYDELGKQVLANLQQGNSLNAQELQAVQQNTMAAQSARGNLYGSAAGYQDALNTSAAATTRGLQRQGQAMAFLTGADPILGGGISTQYEAPSAKGGMDYGELRNLGNQQNALMMQADQYNASQTNPWMQAIGQIGGTYLGTQMGKDS
jgi:hypothetical protein